MLPLLYLHAQRSCWLALLREGRLMHGHLFPRRLVHMIVVYNLIVCFEESLLARLADWIGGEFLRL